MKERDRGRRAGEVDPKAIEALAPGKRTLAQQLGRPLKRRGPLVVDVAPGRLTMTDRIPVRERARAVLDQRSPAATAEDGFSGRAETVPFRAEMEHAFGRSFTDVLVYRDPEAQAAARAIQAEAYVVGNRIAFADEHPTKEVVAHELAHIGQQGDGSSGAAAGSMSSAGDAHEVEADHVASIVASGGVVGMLHQVGRGAAVQRKEAQTRTAASSETQAKPATPSVAAAPVDPELQVRMDRMKAGLVNVTTRWKLIGGDLFTETDKPTMPAKFFEPAAYALLVSDDSDAELLAVEVVLGGPGREEHGKALASARSQYRADKPALADIQRDIADLIAGGQAHHNATRLMAQQALLTPNGKRALIVMSQFGVDKLSAYVTGDCDRHGQLEGQLVTTPTPETIAAGGSERVATCRSLVVLLKTGAAVERTDRQVEASKPELSPEIKAKIEALTRAIDDVIASAKDPASPLGPMIGNLAGTIEAAGPQVREVVWADKARLARLVEAVDPAAARGILAGLDPVERLYKSCQACKAGDDRDNVFALGQLGIAAHDDAFRARMEKGVKLAESGGVYGALRSWLLEHATDQAMRTRVLQHTKLKNEYIDRLTDANVRLIYRLIAHGTETPTAEDRIHEAAETNRPAEVIRGLRALASSDRPRLAALELDAVFRTTIERMTVDVPIDGQMISPYQLAITLWGHEVGAATDPTGVKLQESDPAGGAPLQIEERQKLETELFGACLTALRDEITGRKLDLSDDQRAMVNRMQQIGNAQRVMEILVDFSHRATTAPFVDLLRREKLVFGPEVQKRYNDQFGESLRDWIFRRSGPVSRGGSERVLGTEQGAGVGMFNGQVVMAGEAAKPGMMTLEQALRENVSSGKSIAEHASVESRNLAGFIKDRDVEHVLSTYGFFDAEVCAARKPIEKQTGIQIRTIDLMRNAFVLHSGHLESRLAEKLAGPDLARVHAFMGLTADVDRVAGAAPPSIAEQAEQRFGVLAKLAWSGIARLESGSPAPMYVAARALIDMGKLTPRVVEASSGEPATTAASVAAGQAGHDLEERPPRSFQGYYQAQYGISPDRHAAAVVRAMKDGDRAVPSDHAARLLGIDATLVTNTAVTEPEDGSIGDHNRYLVHAGFSEDVATKNAQEIWAILHGDGRLPQIEAELYGNYNDEEQRLIRIQFRKLSGGIDLTFYVRQAMEFRRRMAEATATQASKLDGLGGLGGLGDLAMPGSSSLGGLAMSLGGGGGVADVLAGSQRSMIGGLGSAAGTEQLVMRGQSATITTMGDDAELDRALAISMHGALDVRTRVRNAVQRKEAGQVLRLVDDLTVDERRQILGDGALVDAMQHLLSSKDYERVYKVITGQADLADRMLSRTVGDTFWKRHVSGAADQAGMKEDVKTYVRHLRLQFDREVRVEVLKKFPPPNPPPLAESIDREVNRRTHEACLAMAADKDIKGVIDQALNDSDAAEVRSVLHNAGEAKEWALVADSNAQQILAEIHTLAPDERQRKLADPAYLRLLGARLPAEQDYRDAMNALAAGADKIDQGGGGLAKLDEKSRTATDTYGSDTDARETLRALTRLSPGGAGASARRSEAPATGHGRAHRRHAARARAPAPVRGATGAGARRDGP